MIDCINYVITHKEFPVRQDDLYRMLCVGGFRKDNALCELDGENIAAYNERINECTGLYWMWKNTSSEYVGLSHYRRWFYNWRFNNDRSRLDADRIQEILCDNGYDIILTHPSWFKWRTYDNISLALDPNLNEKAHQEFLRAISEKQPEYLDAFEQVLMGNHMFICNMFVTRRELMNQYCEWLFSFLTDAADRIDVSECNTRKKRVAGYYAEMLPSVWILKHPEIRVYELPHEMVWG